MVDGVERVVAVVLLPVLVEVEAVDGGAFVVVDDAVVEVRAGGAVVEAGRGRVVGVGCCTTGT